MAQAMATHQAEMQYWVAMQQAQLGAHMQACMVAFQNGLPMSEMPPLPPMPVMPEVPPMMYFPLTGAAQASPAVSYLTSLFFHFNH
jgi:hypothetical protein